MRSGRTWAVLAVAGSLAACAAAEKSGAPPPTAPGANGPGTDMKAVSPSRTGGGAEAPPPIDLARADVDRTGRDVEASLADCTTACRALASFDRATQHLCALSEPAECDGAKARLERARARVLQSCGACK